MGYRVGLCTLGCKVSQYETEAVAEGFERLGFSVLPFSEVCDVYVINTCTVTAESDRKSRQFVRRAIHTNPHAVVMVMGCSAQNDPEAISHIPGVAYVIGTDHKMTLPAEALRLLTQKQTDPEQIIVCNSEDNAETPAQTSPEQPHTAECHVTDLASATFEPMSVKKAPRTRAYVKIEDGCDCRCSYCAIPGARGPVRSRPTKDVLKEVRCLTAGGTREVVLTGIEIASWGRDLGRRSLIDLLEQLDRDCHGVRFRLGSLTPELLRGDFLPRLAVLPSVVPHLHLSIQSGSDTILHAMRRRYNTADVLAGMQRMRQLVPRVQFTCDVMVGFPGETDALFRETVAFLEQARFMDMHIFVYSPRPGTPAATFPDRVPAEVGHRRSQRLEALRADIQADIYRACVEEAVPIPVLFETCRDGVWFGHGDNYLPVRVTSADDLHAQLRLVRPLSFDDDGISGMLTDA